MLTVARSAASTARCRHAGPAGVHGVALKWKHFVAALEQVNGFCSMERERGRYGQAAGTADDTRRVRVCGGVGWLKKRVGDFGQVQA